MLRTHHCGKLRASDMGREAVLCGWVSRVRDHGGVIFADLRDRWGVTQLVFRPELDADLYDRSREVRPEFCIRVRGKVKPRPQGTANPKIPTGEIEVEAEALEILSKSSPPPFDVGANEKVGEEVRLKYRFLDLRRSSMQEGLLFRSKLIQEMRTYLHGLDFVEVETPVLTKSTPEGARDYLVPSRLNPGQFFALPQSPQLFKQLLMVSGYDRYFQVAKCFRDEDLRADRQPEFTQLDIEMSFILKEDLFELMEGLFKHLMEAMGYPGLKTPFPRMSYREAIQRYGTDKPDLRFGLPFVDLTSVFRKSAFSIFQKVLSAGGIVLGLLVPGKGAALSRKDFDELEESARSLGASGLVPMRFTGEGVDSPIAKFLSQEELQGLRVLLVPEPKAGDAAFLLAEAPSKAPMILAEIRSRLGSELKLIDAGAFSFAWVDEFPLFSFSQEEKRWVSEHHPFTSPLPEDIGKLGQDNGAIRAQSYDLVLNGNEIASGSIRIHEPELQKKIFSILGMSDREAKERFGFLLSAFQYGPPPHGGIAVGIDRLVAILLGRESIREVVAFPKTQKALCPLTEAPSPVDPRQLKELGIKVL